MNYDLTDDEKRLIVSMCDSILVIVKLPFASSIFPIRKDKVENITALKKKFC